MFKHHCKDIATDEMYSDCILYLVPKKTSPLAQVLKDFRAHAICVTYNDAMDYMPHITLTPFFDVSKTELKQMVHCLQKIDTSAIKHLSVGKIVETPTYHYIDIHDKDDSFTNKVKKCLEPINAKSLVQRGLHLTLSHNMEKKHIPYLCNLNKKLNQKLCEHRDKCGLQLVLYQRTQTGHPHQFRTIAKF